MKIITYGWTNPQHHRNHPNMHRHHHPHHNSFSPAGNAHGGQSYFWVNSSRGQPVPPNAVICGKDKDGSDIYVGLAHYSGDELPAKVVPRRKEAYVSYNGKEIAVAEYKVLVEKKLKWIPSVGGRIPPGSIPAGRTSSGETLYVGRRLVEGNVMAVGKVHYSHGCIYIPYGGKEISYKEYEILVYE